MRKGYKYLIWLVLLLCLIYQSFPSYAQEPLEDILQRGYISQWLFCGPFDSDRPEGIKNAIKNNLPPLGTRDFWSGYGGITQLLPQRDSQFTIDRKTYKWSSFTANSPVIDTSKIVGGSNECIYFFASYFQASDDRILYINLHTPLGARLWISKTQLTDIPQKFNLETAGIDRTLVKVKKGLNLIILQIPFISIQSLSEITNITPSALQTKLWLEKEPEIGKTGFEFSLRILPALQVGKIFYIPELQPTRIFTKTKISPHQIFHLILFNPYSDKVFPVDITTFLLPEGNLIFEKRLSTLGKEEKIVEVEIPTSPANSDKRSRIAKVIITAPDEKSTNVSAEFTTEVNTLPPEPQSKIYLITGSYEKFQDQVSFIDKKKNEVDWGKKQAIYAYDNPHYGVDLGPASLWLEILRNSPEFLPILKEIVSRGKTSAQNSFAYTDDWFTHPETLIRNLQWGTKLKQALLKDHYNSIYLRNYSGIAPQTIQILSSFSIPGIVSNFENVGNPSIHRVFAPGGDFILLRNLRPAPPFSSINEIKKWCYINHTPLKDLLPEIDILVVENYTPPPLPALLTDLSMHIPPYFVQGNGFSEFFEDISNYLYDSGKINSVPSEQSAIFDVSKFKRFNYNGIHQHLLSKLEMATIQAEKFSTFATLAGANYPDSHLAKLWGNVIIASNPDLFRNEPLSSDSMLLYANMLHQCNTAERLKMNALTKIAGNINTLAYSPIPNREPIPILVFNPNSFETSSPVFVDLSLKSGIFPNGRLFTANGVVVPFLVHTRQLKYSSIPKKILEFVCESIPPLGTKLYLWVPDNHTPSETATSDMYIENDYILIKFDNQGKVVEIQNKGNKDALHLQNDGIDSIGVLSESLDEYQTITEVPVSIKTFKSELKQRVEIQFATQWGLFVKEYSLYNKLPYLYCSYRLNNTEHQPTEIFILATKFSQEIVNKNAFAGMPLFGSHIHLSKDKPIPVTRFIYTSSTKFITTKSKGSYPVSEFTAIKTDETIDYSIMRRAMWRMGISSKEISIETNNTVQSTDIPTDSFLIWAGSLSDLDRVKNTLGADINDELKKELRNREEIGSVFFISCERGNRLLGFTAKDISKIHYLLNDFINMLEKHSEFNIPDSLTNLDTTENKDGRLILFEGTKFAKLDRKNELYIIHGKIELQPYLYPLISSVLNYRILPFPKNIEGSEILKLAYEEPLSGIVTEAHGGQWLPNSTLLSISTDKALILSMKPINISHPLVQEEPPNPVNFCALRVASISNEPVNIKLDSPLGVKNTAIIGLNENNLSTSFPADKEIQLKPWEINTVRLSFDRTKSKNNTSKLLTTNEEDTSYIEDIFNPQTETVPISIGMKLNSSTTSYKVELTLSNLSPFKEAIGTVFLEAKRGDSIGPTEIKYNLPPLTTTHYFVDYTPSTSTDATYIRAWTELNGRQTFAYIKPDQFPCEVNTSIELNKIMINIENKTPLTINGYVLCVVSDYDHIKYNFNISEKISPEHVKFYLPPEAMQNFTFSLLDDIKPQNILFIIRANDIQKIIVPE